MSFRVGDRVNLKRSSENFGRMRKNPKKESDVGTITGVNIDSEYRVKWDLGFANSYVECELRFATVKDTKIARTYYKNKINIIP